MENAVLRALIRGCLRNEKKYQKKLYKAFYGFACNIALRYASNREEASIIMNKGFYSVFTCLSVVISHSFSVDLQFTKQVTDETVLQQFS